MSEEINHVQLKFACTENWDAMEIAEGGRHCDKCQKKVYDFTNSKAAEFERIMAENNYSVCGRFNVQQMAPQSTALPLWKKWLSAAMVLIGINFITNKVAAQIVKHPLTTDTVPNKSKTPLLDAITSKDTLSNISAKAPVNPNEMFGNSEVVPEFPGGNDKLMTFIKKNLDQSKSSQRGRVTITFAIEIDGSLSGVRAIGRSFDDGADKEAVRVIKLSPKWIPAKFNGKPVKVQYTVPVIFN